MIDSDTFNQAITNKITEAVVEQVDKLFATDVELLAHLKSQTISALVRKLAMDNNMSQLIQKAMEDQFADQFADTGIHNEAVNRELSVLDKVVVVENELVSKRINVVEKIIANDTVINGTLTVTGDVDTSTTAWQALKETVCDEVIDKFTTTNQPAIVLDVLAEAKANGIDFNEVLVNGKAVITADTLTPAISYSSLRTVGTLEDLAVTGESTLAGQTLYANAKRVGINTTSPTTALDVWDDEVEIVIGKYKEQTAFVGTSRAQDLIIGVNKSEDIKINTDGVVTVNKFRIGERTISFASSVPGYAGVPGDLVYNTDIDPADPLFAWVCVSDFSWVPLRAAI